jgi:DNA repair photolyase
MRPDASKHVFGTSARLFLNTELGCASSCAYCYLPAEGLGIGRTPESARRLPAESILEMVERDPRVRKGEGGTVFSIGCFSECWDRRSRPQTIELVLGLLASGNPIQIATKRMMSRRDLEVLVGAPEWKNQVVVYVSSAVIGRWQEFEKGTTQPKRRFSTFAACREVGIRAFLYVKPVLPGITTTDVDQFGAVMRQYSVSAVVGDRFEERADGRASPISARLKIDEHADVKRTRVALLSYGKVYADSLDALRDRGVLQ